MHNAWFHAFFADNERLDFLFPAAIKDNKTYVIALSSQIDRLREEVRGAYLPKPIVPIIVVDTPSFTVPRFEWVALTRDGVYACRGTERTGDFPVDLCGYNELVEAMDSLPAME